MTTPCSPSGLHAVPQDSYRCTGTHLGPSEQLKIPQSFMRFLSTPRGPSAPLDIPQDPQVLSLSLYDMPQDSYRCLRTH